MPTVFPPTLRTPGVYEQAILVSSLAVAARMTVTGDNIIPVKVKLSIVFQDRDWLVDEIALPSGFEMDGDGEPTAQRIIPICTPAIPPELRGEIVAVKMELVGPAAAVVGLDVVGLDEHGGDI